MTQTVSRAIDILELCSARPRGLREIADLLGVHRTTILRTVQTLTEAGLVRRNSDGAYGPGFRLAALAHAALDQFDLRDLVHPHIVALSRSLGFTVQFAVPDGGHIVYVDKVQPANSITLNTTIGGHVTLHTAGVSKAILANISASERDRILEHATFERFTPNTLTDRHQLASVLDEVRRLGWAADRGEYDEVSNCIAAPVRDHTDATVGAISITSFRAVAGIDELLGHLPALISATDAVSSELGWRPSSVPEPRAGVDSAV